MKHFKIMKLKHYRRLNLWSEYISKKEGQKVCLNFTLVENYNDSRNYKLGMNIIYKNKYRNYFSGKKHAG